MTPVDFSNVLLGIMVGVGVITTTGGAACVLAATRRRKGLPNHAPPITVLKPLKGLDEGLADNLRSFFELDYPEYQLVFGVADDDDPAIGVVRKLQREHPERDAVLVVGCPPFGLNPKVENLAAMDRHRKHDVLLISDSNVRARPEYLRETACYLATPGVGLVTNLFVGVGEAWPSAVMENLEINGFIAGAVATASTLGATCVVGKSMLMPARALEAIGGFAAVRDYLAEDQAIAIRLRQAGLSIRLSHHVLENVNVARSLRWFLNRHSRWYKIRRRMAPSAFLAEPVANLTALGLVWAFSGDSGVAWGGLLGLVGLGMARDALQTRWLRGSFPKPRHLLYSPVKDLLLLPLWFDALVNRRVIWRGNHLLVGPMTLLQRARTSRRDRNQDRDPRRPRVHQLQRAGEQDGRPSQPSPTTPGAGPTGDE